MASGSSPAQPGTVGGTGTRRDRMKCPKCRAVVDDGLERCTFCGNYFQSSMMEEYKLDNYDPTVNYAPNRPPPQPIEKPKSKFKLFGK